MMENYLLGKNIKKTLTFEEMKIATQLIVFT